MNRLNTSLGLLLVLLGASSAMAQANTFPATGNVGIGTSSPEQTLEVDGGDVYVASGSIGLSAGGGGAYESQLSTAYNFPYIDTYLDSIAGAAWEGRLHFRTNSGGGAMTDRLVIDGANGNVGIGTTTPGADLASLAVPPSAGTPILEVKGDIALALGSGGEVIYQDGTVQSTAWNGTTLGGDYAESVDVSGDRKRYEPGDVLVIDSDTEGSFLKSVEPYSTSVSGIYSTRPGLVGRRQLTDRSHVKDEVPMAMAGIVPTKVCDENGPIRPGDLLVTSSRLGYAMKGTDRSKMLGAVIGKALGHLDADTGVIEVVVTLQ